MQLNPMQSVNTLLLFLGKDTGDTEAGIAHYMTGRGLKRLTSPPRGAGPVPRNGSGRRNRVGSSGGFAPLAGRDPPGILNGQDVYLPLAAEVGMCLAADRLENPVHERIGAYGAAELLVPAHTGLGCRNWASSGPSTLPDPHRRRAGYVRDISPRARLVTR